MNAMEERRSDGSTCFLFSRKMTLLPFLALLLVIPHSEAVSATPAISVTDIHPVLRWVCNWSDNDLRELGGIHLLVDSARQKPHSTATTIDICSNFRGGETNPNTIDSDNATGSTDVILEEKSGPLDFATSEYAFSLFQEGDGSQEDPDGIPRRYLKMQGDRREQAKKALEVSLAWRKEHDIDTILARPHAKFDRCKRVFPHYFCGRDDTNHVILLQRPGLINLKTAHSNDVSGEDLLYHYIYEMEYLWQILEPAANGTMTSIIDLTGLNLSVLGKRELMSVVQKFCSTMDAHFPTRSHKMLLINAPKWFGAIYKIISPLLRESTKQKISILSKGEGQDKALKELLAECPIVSDDKIEEIPASPMEDELRDFVSVERKSKVMVAASDTSLMYLLSILSSIGSCQTSRIRVGNDARPSIGMQLVLSPWGGYYC